MNWPPSRHGYVFAALMLWIVWRAGRGAAVDSRRAARLRRLSPMTGLCGEMVVLEGDERARRGMRYPVIREGTLGSAAARTFASDTVPCAAATPIFNCWMMDCTCAAMPARASGMETATRFGIWCWRTATVCPSGRFG